MSNVNLLEDEHTSVPCYASHKDDIQDGAEPGRGVPAVVTEDEELADIKLLSLLPLLEHAPGLNLQEDRGTYHIHGRITPSDKSALMYFSRRVRELKLSTTIEDGRRLAPAIFFKLAKLSDLLFPYLEHLSIEAEDTIFDALEIFLSPSLHSVEICGAHEHLEPSFASCLATLREITPASTSVSIRDCNVSQTILDSLTTFQHLTRLEFHNSSLETAYSLVEHAGKFKALESLIFHFPLGQELHVEECTIQKPISSGPFLRLRYLFVSGSPEVLEDFLRYVSCSTPADLVLSFLDIGYHWQPEYITHTLEIALDHWIHNLVSVTIQISSITRVTDKVISQLLHSSVLRHLEFDKDMTIVSLNMCLLGLSGVTCPQLETLLLPIGSASWDTIELWTLEVLLEACPNLKSLRCRLGQRAGEVPPLPDSHRLHGLESLHLENHVEFPDSASQRTAYFLDMLCPFLQKLVMVGDGEAHATWKQIYNSLSMYQKIRAGERERLMKAGFLLVVNGDGKSLGNEAVVTLCTAIE